MKIAIVTGASSNHFQPLLNLLSTLDFHEPNTRVIVYDLGLSENELARLIADGRELRRFDFENFPSHVQLKPFTGNLITRNEESGHYAWKPTILVRTAIECRSAVWMDSGNLVHGRLDGIRAELNRCGLYTPFSDGIVRQWTRIETARYFGFGEEISKLRNRNAAVIGVNFDFYSVRHLINRLASASLDPACICPEGSSWLNNRCDQAILSVLVPQWCSETNSELCDELLGVSIHNDRLSYLEAMRKAGVSMQRMVLRPLPRTVRENEALTVSSR